MTRIVEHAPLGLRYCSRRQEHRGWCRTPMLATVNVTKFSSRPEPDLFVDPLPVADALQASPMRNGPGSPA